jgi:DNA recombination protein RmuC
MILQIIGISLTACAVVLLIVLLSKKNKGGSDQSLKAAFQNQADLYQHINKIMLENIKGYNESVLNAITQQTVLQKHEFGSVQNRLELIHKNNEEKLNRATDVLGKGLEKLQADNERKLDQMRQTVDEKLNANLERRLGESFNLINQRLQSVYEGLGEMKTLASGVGDLKKVLTNVKTRGTWGEVQLLNLLEQILAHQQFAQQVDIRGNGERVDFVVIMPGKDDEQVLLPIDAKFPIEDYQRVTIASESGNKEEFDLALKALEKRVKEDAKSIKEKYICLPKTTDFAIMYLATEGLYAEVLRRPGLTETLQRDYKVVVCGPTTITALLNSLQLGFKTLSIEKRSSEVYQLLGVFKQEFGKFVDLLAKTQKKLMEASNTIEAATKKSRTIERKLKSVSVLDETTLIEGVENDEA